MTHSQTRQTLRCQNYEGGRFSSGRTAGVEGGLRQVKETHPLNSTLDLADFGLLHIIDVLPRSSAVYSYGA
jgi:hypothetical protein